MYLASYLQYESSFISLFFYDIKIHEDSSLRITELIYESWYHLRYSYRQRFDSFLSDTHSSFTRYNQVPYSDGCLWLASQYTCLASPWPDSTAPTQGLSPWVEVLHHKQTGLVGFEPTFGFLTLLESKSSALPLGDSPLLMVPTIIICFKIWNMISKFIHVILDGL